MIGALINLLIYVLVLGLLVALVNYAVDNIPRPDPLGRMLKIVAVVVFAIIIILLLLQMVGVVPVSVPRLT
jgi:hypothetical protein